VSPGELLELKRFGYLLASTADCQGVEEVDDVETYVRGRFAVVVGNAELAKRRGGAHDVGNSLRSLNTFGADNIGKGVIYIGWCLS